MNRMNVFINLSVTLTIYIQNRITLDPQVGSRTSEFCKIKGKSLFSSEFFKTHISQNTYEQLLMYFKFVTSLNKTSIVKCDRVPGSA